MEDLIKSLQIFIKYKNERYPTNCDHDSFVVCGIKEDEISDEDKKELERLSFIYDYDYCGWVSFRFGSC